MFEHQRPHLDVVAFLTDPSHPIPLLQGSRVLCLVQPLLGAMWQQNPGQAEHLFFTCELCNALEELLLRICIQVPCCCPEHVGAVGNRQCVLTGACRARRRAGLLPIVPEGWAMRDPVTDPDLVELGTIRLVANVRCSAMRFLADVKGCLAHAIHTLQRNRAALVLRGIGQLR